MQATQNNPKVIDGTLAEITNFPVGNMTAGTFFFARDVSAAYPNGRLFILDINGSARSWKEITSSSQHPQTARFIVGNALSGDTTADCTFLDPGDGSGIQAAIAAASLATRGDIFVRSGSYTRPSGAPAFTIPGNVTVRGSGSETKITGNDTQRTIFLMLTGSSLKDLFLQLPTPVAMGTTGSAAVVCQNNATEILIQNVTVDFKNTFLADSVRSAFSGNGNTKIRILDCVATGGPVLSPNLFGDLISLFRFTSLKNSTLTGQSYVDTIFHITGATSENLNIDVQGDCYKAALLNDATNCNVKVLCKANWPSSDGDYGIMIVTEVTQSSFDCNIQNTSEATVVGHSVLYLGSNTSNLSVRANLSQANRGVTVLGSDITIHDSFIRTNGVTTAGTYGVYLENTSDNVALVGSKVDGETCVFIQGTGHRISGCTIVTSLASSRGIHVNSNADRTNISASRIEGTTGILLEGLQTQVSGCVVVAGDVGVSVTTNSNRSSVSGCFVSGTIFGIEITGDRSMITGNNISSLPLGTGVDVNGVGSLYNSIVANSIVASVPTADTGTGTIIADNQTL